MKSVLVTGATGHLGANIVRELLAGGRAVVPLVRPTANRIALQGLDLEAAVGDILNRASLRGAMADCDAVIHSAAAYVMWARNPNDIIRTAVQGTRNVLHAAKEAGIKRVVYTSSVAAVGYSADPARPYDERRWNARARNPYIRGKTEAEQLAFELGSELGLEVVSLLPVGVLGRLDYRKTPTSAGVVDPMAGKGPIIAAANLCDVRDTARAHVLALEAGRPGERYIVGGDNVGLAELAELIEPIAGKKPPQSLPPKALLWPAAVLMEGMARVTGKPPAITRDAIHDVVGRHFVYDTTKMRQELDLEPRGAREVIAETARWAAFMGWLGKRRSAKLSELYPPDPAWHRL